MDAPRDRRKEGNPVTSAACTMHTMRASGTDPTSRVARREMIGGRNPAGTGAGRRPQCQVIEGISSTTVIA
jgi:hypothetical protein